MLHVGVVIHVGHVGGQVTLGVSLHVGGDILAADGEGGHVKHVQLAALQLLYGLVNGGLGAVGGHVGVQVGQNHGLGGQGAGPVSVDGLAVHDSLDGVDIVGSPVNAGGDDVGVGANGNGGAVVGHVGHAGLLAGGGSTHGVSVLADQNAAVLDQLLGAFLLGGLIVPAAGEGHFHGGGGADGASAQEEGGVAGDNLGIGESADIADLGLVRGELTALDHLVELHTGSDTGEVTALIDGSEGVVVVGKTLGVSLGAGGVAELHVGEVLRGLNHVVLVTERVGEDDVAAGISQLSGLVVALLTLGNVGDDGVFDTELLAGLFRSVDEVEVVGGVFVVEHDEADLEIGDFVVVLIVGVGIVLLIAAGDEGEDHDETQEQCKELLHFSKSSLNFTAIKRFEYRYHHDT